MYDYNEYNGTFRLRQILKVTVDFLLQQKKRFFQTMYLPA